MGLWYEPARDGTIHEYIANCRADMMPKCFKGYEQFRQLVELGYVTPLVTSIRLMYNHGRDDEFYGVVDDFKLEGIILNSHSGKSGVHEPEDILADDKPYFEIEMINPNPEPISLKNKSKR